MRRMALFYISVNLFNVWFNRRQLDSHILLYLVCYESLLWWKYIKKYNFGASLVAQWLRICLPMQGTRVRALVWEDPTCRGATGPVSHNY